jgi:outer membrane protein assembly factor BamB
MRRVGGLVVLLAVLVIAGVLMPAPLAPAAPAAQSSWPTYLADPARTSASDARISPLVSPYWTHVVSGFIASEPIIVNNRVYITAWDGYLYALDQFDGHEIWRTFLGTYQIKPACPGSPNLLGITAAPTFDAATNLLYASAMSATVVITSDSPPARDTGPYVYAIDPANGAIQWEQVVSANNDNYAWSSPLVANGRAYVGVASQGDCPLTQGQLVAVGLTGTHTVQRAAMAPDSLTVYPTDLITSANPPTTTLLLDGSDYNFTATATIDFRGPLSAAISIRLRHAQVGNFYQPELHRRDQGQTCEGGLTFVQFLDDARQAGSSGVLDFARDITLDTAALNDGEHFLVVPGLVSCALFEAGTGGGIWSSPTYDAPANRVYVTTGTPSPPCVPQTMCNGAPATLGPRSAAVVALDGDTLAVAWSWQVSFLDQKFDADFGATPALCTADNGKRILGVANKNGLFYAFDTQASGSPIWQRQIAIGGGGPEIGQGSISSATCAGGVFYVGAGMPPDNAVVCAGFTGQVWALFAAGGEPRWTDPYCTSLVMGPVTAAGGMVMYGANCRSLLCPRHIEMLDQATGALRYQGTPLQLAGLGDMVSGIAVVDGLMVSGDSLKPPGGRAAFPLTGTVRALNTLPYLYLPLVTR